MPYNINTLLFKEYYSGELADAVFDKLTVNEGWVCYAMGAPGTLAGKLIRCRESTAYFLASYSCRSAKLMTSDLHLTILCARCFLLMV
jgi:hypothetical protein